MFLSLAAGFALMFALVRFSERVISRAALTSSGDSVSDIGDTKTLR